MKVCRFDEGRVGVVREGRVFDVTDALAVTASTADPAGDWIADLEALAAMPAGAIEACQSCDLADVRLLAPVRAPGKIIAAPLNYEAHIREMVAGGLLADHAAGEIETAGLFLKATSSLAGPSQGVRLRFPERRTDHEVELVAVIGRRASQVSAETALSHVAGYCVGLDITLRGPEDRSFRKSIDTYAVLGPWLTTADEVADPQDLRLTLSLNGEVRQDSSTADMVMGVARLIAFASRFYTLHPGDVLFTGSPVGVGPIVAGDLLRAECSGLGGMSVAVRSQ